MGERIITLTAAEIREHRTRAEVRGEVDPTVFVAALDVLETLLASVRRGSLSRGGIRCALDVAEVFEDAVEEIEERESAAKERESATKERESTAAAEVARVRAEADERCRELDATVQEWRARAERAEHALATGVVSDRGLARRVREAAEEGVLLREYREQCEDLQRRVASQERHLSALARVVAAGDLGPDAQTLALAVVGGEVHRRLSAGRHERVERAYADVVAERDALLCTVERLRARTHLRRRGEKKSTPQ